MDGIELTNDERLRLLVLSGVGWDVSKAAEALDFVRGAPKNDPPSALAEGARWTPERKRLLRDLRQGGVKPKAMVAPINELAGAPVTRVQVVKKIRALSLLSPSRYYQATTTRTGSEQTPPTSAGR